MTYALGLSGGCGAYKSQCVDCAADDGQHSKQVEPGADVVRHGGSADEGTGSTGKSRRVRAEHSYHLAWNSGHNYELEQETDHTDSNERVCTALHLLIKRNLAHAKGIAAECQQ